MLVNLIYQDAMPITTRRVNAKRSQASERVQTSMVKAAHMHTAGIPDLEGRRGDPNQPSN